MAPTTADSTKDVEKKSTQRRINKPLIEKRRRARINECLTQLQAIVLESNCDSKASEPSKLEKADILEMTVEFLKRKTSSHNLEASIESNKEVTKSEYMEGYSKCVREISNFLEQTRSINQDFKQDIVNHMSTQITNNAINSNTTHTLQTNVTEQASNKNAVELHLNKNSSNSEAMDLRINTSEQKKSKLEHIEANNVSDASEPTNHINSLKYVTNNQLPIGLLYGGQVMLLLQVPPNMTSQQLVTNNQAPTKTLSETPAGVDTLKSANVAMLEDSYTNEANTLHNPTLCQSSDKSIRYDCIHNVSLENKNTHIDNILLQKMNTPTLLQNNVVTPLTGIQLFNMVPTVFKQNNEDPSSHWRPW